MEDGTFTRSMLFAARQRGLSGICDKGKDDGTLARHLTRQATELRAGYDLGAIGIADSAVSKRKVRLKRSCHINSGGD